MSNLIYPFGLTEWSDLNNTDFRWMLLLASHTVNPVDQFVADVSGDEATDPSYSRQTLSGATITPHAGGVTYDCDDVAFGNLVGGESLGWCVLYRLVTNDLDSPLLAAYRIAKITDGTPVTVVFDPAGIHEHTAN